MNNITLNTNGNVSTDILQEKNNKSCSHSYNFQDIKDEFTSAKKKRGAFAKFYDNINEMFSIGISETNVSDKIKDLEKGKITKEEAKQYIDRYEKANNNSSEITADTFAALTGIGISMFAKKAKNIAGVFTGEKYKTKMLIAGALASIAGAIAVKSGIKAIDSFGKDKEVREQEKTAKTNIITGAADGISGVLSTITPVLIPAGIAINAFTRYVTEKNDDSSLPSISDFIERQKDTIGIGLIGTAAVVGAAAKGHINLSKVKAAIKNAKINTKHAVSYKEQAQLTEFQQLARDIGYDLSVIVKDGKFDPLAIPKLDKDFIKILLEKGQTGKITEKLEKIEKENIFLPKYLQTVIDIPETKQDELVKQIDRLMANYEKRKQGNWDALESKLYYALRELEQEGMDINGVKDLQAIIKNIKSNCPASRTIDEAKAMIAKEYKDEYEITRLLGVGSIAESYLAKNKKGDEVVIKLVKQHFLDTDKIAADKNKILQKIEERSKCDTWKNWARQTIDTEKRKEYDISQIDNMYEVWGNEINLAEEALSASQIGKQAQNFSPVGVIDSKKSIFIMEKAKGVQLDSSKFAAEWKKAGLTEADFKNFVENYVKVYCEQLFSLPKDGLKVVQSDPHGGNILVDIPQIKNLKSGSKPITIIDYGNTTKTDKNEAIKNLFNHVDYLIGNTDGIARAMIEGAKLGNNNKEQVIKELSDALKEKIFNCDTKIDVENPVKIFSIVNSFCSKFLLEKNIIPNATLINQMKAEETYIISNLGCLSNLAVECGYDIEKAVDRDLILKQLVNEMAKAAQDAGKLNPSLTAREIYRRYNYFVNNTETALSCLGNNFDII